MHAKLMYVKKKQPSLASMFGRYYSVLILTFAREEAER